MLYMAECVVSLNSRIVDLDVITWHYVTLAVCRFSKSLFFLNFLS
jgi:hypothetical protein